jgi:HAD superfamily hydrolase (TIGR01549 family)
MVKPYLIFDAGGTLVFPDFKYLSDVAQQYNISTHQDQLFNIHCDLIFKLDVQTLQNQHLLDPFPNGYTDTLFGKITQNPEMRTRLIETVAERHRKQSIWTSTYPWVSETLMALKTRGYSMSVVSNSDGRVVQILDDLHLEAYFDRIFDSDLIGFSKPDVRLFHHALNSLDLHPDEVIYIGDVYSIDVWGANQAGMGCIHLDPKNLYGSWPGVHLPSVAEMVAFLDRYLQKPSAFDLYPAANLAISF